MGSTIIQTEGPLPDGFKERMFTVFVYWAMHWSKEEIAEIVLMSRDAVDMDIRHIYLALNVAEKADALQQAWLTGLFKVSYFEGIEWRGGR